MKFILRSIVSFFIILIVFFSFLVATAKKPQVLYEKPFLANVHDFAVSDDSIYTLDSTYHTICKYDLDGNFVFAITYTSTGAGRIFVRDNLLYRYELRANKVYVYSETGEVMEKIDKNFSELVQEGVLEKNPPNEIERNGKKYSFKNRLILDSELTFDSRKIVVESVWYHIIVCVTVILMILLFLFALYNIARFCINNWLEDQNKDRGRFPVLKDKAKNN